MYVFFHGRSYVTCRTQVTTQRVWKQFVCGLCAFCCSWVRKVLADCNLCPSTQSLAVSELLLRFQLLLIYAGVGLTAAGCGCAQLQWSNVSGTVLCCLTLDTSLRLAELIKICMSSDVHVCERVCVCLDVNRGGTNRSRCTQRLVILRRTDLLMNPDRIPKTRSAWPTLRVNRSLDLTDIGAKYIVIDKTKAHSF